MHGNQSHTAFLTGWNVISMVVLTLLLCASADAEEWHVPGDFPTIQQAIEAASDGAHIIVAAGVYQEHLDFLGKSLVLRSAAGPAVTVIDGSHAAGSVITITSGEGPGTSLQGFTITGGTGTETDTFHNTLGGGGLLAKGSTVEIADCVFTGNSAERGGGVYAREATISFHGSRLINNTADSRGGGIYGWHESSLTLDRCVLAGNLAIYNGGAIYLSHNSSLSASRSTFLSNAVAPHLTSTGEGGAVASVGSTGLHLIDCVFRGNFAEFGGAIHSVVTPTEPVIENCEFVGNEAYRFGLGSNERAGGAIHGGSFVVKNADFRHNAARRGGAIFAWSGTIERSKFLHNVAEAAGAVFTENTLDLRNSVFFDNSATHASVFRHRAGPADVINCVIGRQAPGHSTLIELQQNAEAVIRNTTIVPNPVEPNGSLVRNSNSDLVITNSIVLGHDEPIVNNFGNATTEIRFSNLSGDGDFDGHSNMSVDSAFSNPKQLNFRLLPSSPLIDAGSNDDVPADVKRDIEGHPRIVDGTGDTIAQTDLGAHEYQPDPCPGRWLRSFVALHLDSDSLTVPRGFTQRLRAFAERSDGSRVDVTDSLCITWRSTNTAIAEVDHRGIVAGKQTGETKVIARFGRHAAEAHVKVNRNGEAIYVIDDVSDDSVTDIGNWTAYEFAWMNYFFIEPGAEVINAILVDWGNTTYPGRNVRLVLWADPSQDGWPGDAEPLVIKPVIAAPSEQRFVRYKIEPTDVGPAGTGFFVGVLAERVASATGWQGWIGFGSGSLAGPARQSWYAASDGLLDPESLHEATLIQNSELSTPFVYRVRADGISIEQALIGHLLDLVGLPKDARSGYRSIPEAFVPSGFDR